MVQVQGKIEKQENSPKKITWEQFERRYLSREDGYKYEWVDGQVEKTPKRMNKEQLFILKNLQLFFQKLNIKTPIKGMLIAEIDTLFAENHRKPDIAFLTFDQIEAGRRGESMVPEFVIEVISTHDKINRVEKKMNDYYNANVKVVWHVFPEYKKVHVYNGKKMVMCMEGDTCSADAVIKGFKIDVDDIFA